MIATYKIEVKLALWFSTINIFNLILIHFKNIIFILLVSNIILFFKRIENCS